MAAETLLVSMTSLFNPCCSVVDAGHRLVPLGILAIVLVALFEVYKDDFERWVQPLATWLTDRDEWSWVIPVGILFLLSFPPLFGHEIVLIIVGVSHAWAAGSIKSAH